MLDGVGGRVPLTDSTAMVRPVSTGGSGAEERRCKQTSMRGQPYNPNLTAYKHPHPPSSTHIRPHTPSPPAQASRTTQRWRGSRHKAPTAATTSSRPRPAAGRTPSLLRAHPPVSARWPAARHRMQRAQWQAVRAAHTASCGAWRADRRQQGWGGVAACGGCRGIQAVLAERHTATYIPLPLPLATAIKRTAHGK